MSEEALLKTTIPATFVSYARGKYHIKPRYAILKIDNATTREEAENYLLNGVYLSWTNKNGELVENRGYIRRVHGSKGAVRAVFQRNLHPRFLGERVYVKLYKCEDILAPRI